MRSNSGSVQSNCGSAASTNAMARSNSGSVQSNCGSAASTNAMAQSSCRSAPSRSGTAAHRNDCRRSSTTDDCCWSSEDSAGAIEAGKSDCPRIAVRCYSWVKSHASPRRWAWTANQSPHKADDRSAQRVRLRLRHSTADPTIHCQTPVERDHGQWHCLEPTNCVRRLWGDWPMHCYFH